MKISFESLKSLLQSEFGRYGDLEEETLSKPGVVTEINEERGINVAFDDKSWWFKASAVEKVFAPDLCKVS